MKRHIKEKHKVQSTCVRPSTSKGQEEKDLAYHVHDRVELMRQVFSTLKSKEIKSMAPGCFSKLTNDELQELCLEELLGISSKRICAVLDGVDPPSNTESSETESEDVPAQDTVVVCDSDDGSKKKKKKRKHKKKRKRKKRTSTSTESSNATTHAEEDIQDDVVEVEVKEEVEIVEISSDDEKPNISEIDINIDSTKNSKKDTEEEEKEKIIQEKNKAVNKKEKKLREKEQDLKEKERLLKEMEKELKEVQRSVTENTSPTKTVHEESKSPEINEDLDIHTNTDNTRTIKMCNKELVISVPNTTCEKEKTKQTKVVKATRDEKQSKLSSINLTRNDESQNSSENVVKKRIQSIDNDEICLELSDSEKSAFLEDNLAFNRNMSNEVELKDNLDKNAKSSQGNLISSDKEISSNVDVVENSDNSKQVANSADCNISVNYEILDNSDIIEDKGARDVITDIDNVNKVNICLSYTKTIDVTNINDIPVVNEEFGPKTLEEQEKSDAILEKNASKVTESKSNTEKSCLKVKKKSKVQKKGTSPSGLNLEEGELTDASSEVETVEIQDEIICISDDETGNIKKKKKKKDKKHKKRKKDKDNLKSSAEDTTKETNKESNELISINKANEVEDTAKENKVQPLEGDSDNVYEILEISDDSSCYEFEGITVSKEPTTEEIEALSAKIDEIKELERREVVTEEEIKEYERKQLEKDISIEEKEVQDTEIISWKDRYLGSRKVKKVLTTANILNAMRKKNIELKKKIEDSRRIDEPKIFVEDDKDDKCEDGSIEQYNTLQGSTKYVDPVKETLLVQEKDKDGEEKEDNIDLDGDSKEKEQTEEVLTKGMKKDAKQLLKMYKRLLKYNDLNKVKKKKKKKSKETVT